MAWFYWEKGITTPWQGRINWAWRPKDALKSSDSNQITGVVEIPDDIVDEQTGNWDWDRLYKLSPRPQTENEKILADRKFKIFLKSHADDCCKHHGCSHNTMDDMEKCPVVTGLVEQAEGHCEACWMASPEYQEEIRKEK